MPLVFKQARAIIDKRTTVVCLDIHGAMVPVDEPFETMAGDFQRPPFHVHCRTLVGPRMPGFLSDARAEANAELQNRPKKERRKGPGWEIGGQIPGPTTKNPPSGFSRQLDELSYVQQDALLKAKRLFEAKQTLGQIALRDDPWAPDVVPVPAVPPVPVSMEEAADLIDAHFVIGTEEERRATGLYVAGMTWSNDLRNGTASEHTRQRVAEIVSLINKQEPFSAPVTLYRGMSSKFLPGELNDLIGTVIKDLGLMSTSLDKETAALFQGSGVMLEIIAPAGTRALPVNHARLPDQSGTPEEFRIPANVIGSESEILLPPGTALKVIGLKERMITGKLIEVVQAVIVNE